MCIPVLVFPVDVSPCLCISVVVYPRACVLRRLATWLVEGLSTVVRLLACVRTNVACARVFSCPVFVPLSVRLPQALEREAALRKSPATLKALDGAY